MLVPTMTAWPAASSRVGVVLGQSLDHAFGAVAQRHEPCRREDAHLAHPASDQFARAPRPPDERTVTDDDRPNRAAEALAQAEGHRIGWAGEIDWAHAERHDRVPEARSIDVEIGSAQGPTHFRVHEAPFDPSANELFVLCSRHVALAAGDIRVTVRDDRGALRGEFVLTALTAAASA